MRVWPDASWRAATKLYSETEPKHDGSNRALNLLAKRSDAYNRTKAGIIKELRMVIKVSRHNPEFVATVLALNWVLYRQDGSTEVVRTNIKTGLLHGEKSDIPDVGPPTGSGVVTGTAWESTQAQWERQMEDAITNSMDDQLEWNQQ
jgi:hypothetical protein